MKTISIITQKGGVGKTTATIHIGATLSEMGHKVLLIDLDTQINLSLGYNISDYSYTIENFLKEKSPVFHKKGRNENLFILAGSSSLREKKLKKNALKNALKLVEKDFDYVLIDCPPKPINDEISFGEIAVIASDFVISPILADKYSLAGINGFLKSVYDLKAKGETNANVLGFFFNIVEENTNHFQNYYSLLKNSEVQGLLLKNYIRKDINIKNAMDEGKTIFEIRPNGRSARDYERLTQEIIMNIQKY